MNEKLLTTGKVAEMLGIPKRTIQQKIKEGKIKPAKITEKGYYLLSLEQIEQLKTAQVDSKTAQVDSKTAQVESKTAQVESKTAQNDSKTAQVDSKTAQNDSKTAQNDSKTAQVDSKTAQVESKTAQVESKTAQNDSKTAQVDSKTAQNDSKTAQNDSKTAQVESKTAQVESKIAQNDSKTAQVESKTAQNDSKTAQVESKTAQNNIKRERERLKEEARSFFALYLRSLGIDINHHFSCLNPAHNDSKPSMKFNPDTYTAHCFGCGVTYDIFNAFSIETGISLTDKRLFDTVFEWCGLTSNKPKLNPSTNFKPKYTPSKNLVDLTPYFNECHKYTNDKAFIDYMKSRGLFDSALIDKFNIGYDFTCRCAVIPHDEYSATRRYLQNWTDKNDVEHRYKYLSGAPLRLFNKAALNDEIVFITEGAFDALSIIKAGGNAVAVGGARNFNKTLIPILNEVDNKPLFVILFDQDKSNTGQDAAAQLKRTLNNLDYFALETYLPNLDNLDKTDANALLVADEEALKSFVANTIKQAKEEEKAWQLSKPARINVDIDSEERDISIPKLGLSLVLPDGYSMSYNGISEYIWNAKKKKFDVSLVSYSPIIISKIIDNVDDNIAKTEIACYDVKKKKWRKIVDDNSVIFNSGTITSLAKRHLDVSSITAGRLVNYLSKFKAVNIDKIPDSETINHIGWRNGEFLPLSNKSNFELDDSIRADFLDKFKSKGDKEKVIPLIKELKTYDIANAILGAALAAPMTQNIFDHNIAIHFAGITGSGKTAANTLIYSLFYNSEHRMPRFNATRNALGRYFAGMRDLPIFIDDFSNADDNQQRKVQLMILDFVNGTDKMRTNKNLDMPKPAEFYGSLLTTGEQFLTTNTTIGGAKTREMEFDSGIKFLTDNLSAKIYDITKDNYGLFLADWIKIIQANVENIKRLYKILNFGGEFYLRKIQGFQHEFKGKVPRHINNIAAITTSNIVFDTFVLGIPSEEALDSEIACAKRIFELLPTYEQVVDYKRAIPKIRDWIISHPKFFIQSREFEDTNGAPHNQFETEANGPETYGVIRKNYVAVTPDRLEMFLQDNGFSLLTIRQLADDGFILRNNKNLTTPIPNYPSRGLQTRMYKIPADHIFETMK